MNNECKCEDKIILVEGSGSEARETWCPKHGYQNSCYLCGQPTCGCQFRRNYTTELCVMHANWMGRA